MGSNVANMPAGPSRRRHVPLLAAPFESDDAIYAQGINLCHRYALHHYIPQTILVGIESPQSLEVLNDLGIRQAEAYIERDPGLEDSIGS